MGVGNRTNVIALTMSLVVHGIIAWFSPQDGPVKKSPETRERRIVARTFPKRVKPQPKVKPKEKKQDTSPVEIKKDEPKSPTVEPEPAAAKVPEPVVPKTEEQPKKKRAPKKRSGRNLTSKRKRPGKKAVAPGSKRGGPKNIGDWDPSGPAGPGAIDPNGGNTEGDRVERLSPRTTKATPDNNGDASGKKSRKKRKTTVRAAVPVYRPTPRWPNGLIKSGPISVPVKVRLDAAGKIISARAMGSAPKLAKQAAVSFVKSIRWRPARQGDKNVKFNLVYMVKFRP